MAPRGHQYATVPGGDSRWPLSSNAQTPSPTLPELPHTPLSSAFEDLAGALYIDEPPEKQKQSVSDVLRSLTGSQQSTQSYELVEEDDYEQAQATPRPKMMAEAMAVDRPPSPKDATPVRTASISRNLPLHNPTPDLQSLQGAYVKNVQALEDSAERISLAESMEEELQKIKADMRRSESLRHAAPEQSHRKFSSTSRDNSIIGVNAAARSGGYSPAAFITSPVGSIRSQRQPSQRVSRMSKASITLPEPELEGRPLESAMVHSPPAHAMQPRPSTESQRSVSHHSLSDRPGTSASNDTYRQAQNLFTDFDGIHFSPIEEDGRPRRISLNHPPLARDSRVYREQQPDQKMIYYPAPVPVMLNLPKRLSKANWSQQEKRRTVALNQINSENRKSAAWLAAADDDAHFAEDVPLQSKRMSTLPPQLRASAFFDAPSTRTDIQLKHGSAVMTLDNILDAAAHAPVSAFTDHPIAGHLGDEVYGKELGHKKKSSEIKQHRKSSMSNLLNRRKSSGTLEPSRRLSQTLENEIEMSEDDPEKVSERSIAPGEDELGDDAQLGSDKENESSEDEAAESEHQLGFLGAPTTLLAELQMRKAQQKLRNRTAANAFPAGMHSTLLELDAVTQLQQKSRKQKHVALAWEDQVETDKANYDDEDVPLGVLFPEKERQTHVNLSRPLGLMEKKELEENEPLSFRRARLRGEPYKPPQPEPSPAPVEPAPTLTLAGMNENEEEEQEEETLAQRRKRLENKKSNKRQSLADDIASQLGLDPEQIGGSKTPEVKEDEQEETLGQRRKRLQEEAEKQGVFLKPKTSMGDLLLANPVGSRNNERQSSAESKVNLLMNRRDPNTSLVDHIQAQQPNGKALPPPNPPPYFPNQPLLHQHQQQQTRQSQVPQQQPWGSSPYLPQMPSMTTIPTLNTFGQQPQFPYNQQQPNMLYNPLMPQMMMNLQMPQMMNNMNMPMGAMQMPMPMPYAQAAPAYDPIGMGPPLTNQQRANIDRWRQGIA